MIPSLALLLTTGKSNPGVYVGSILAFLGALTFLGSVVMVWRKSQPA